MLIVGGYEDDLITYLNTSASVCFLFSLSISSRFLLVRGSFLSEIKRPASISEKESPMFNVQYVITNF